MSVEAVAEPRRLRAVAVDFAATQLRTLCTYEDPKPMVETSTSRYSRRSILTALAATPLSSLGSRHAAAQSLTGLRADARAQAALQEAQGTRLVMLGTGAGPVPMVPGRRRFMTSHVMLSNGAAYVLDVGLGVTNEFARTGIRFGAVRSVFITHHHPDHNIEYGPFLVIGWVNGLKLAVKAYGPPPLKQMTADFLAAYRTTVDFWAEDFKMAPLHRLDVSEVSAAGPVMQDENVKVSAAIVNHPPVKPALGYRFDFHDRSIAFSGDTTPLEVMAQLAEGADVLVHEAMYVPALRDYVRAEIARGQPVQFDTFMAHMNADHSSVDAVGRIAQLAGVKTLVLSHLTPEHGVPDATWRREAAKAFKGTIIIGQDLMVI